MSGAARLLIADKNPLVLKGLQAILEEDRRFTLAAVLDTGAGFLAAAAETPFDVGVIGWMLPDMDGGEVLRRLKAMESPARMVVYTGSRNPDAPRLAMKFGGYGFCSKSDPPEVLLDVIQSVALGRMSFPYVDVSKLNEDPLSDLTGRERELLAALRTGDADAAVTLAVDALFRGGDVGRLHGELRVPDAGRCRDHCCDHQLHQYVESA